MTMWRAILALILLAGGPPARAQSPEQRAIWNRPAEPFRIAGNVHYVGTAGLSAFLVTDPAGHVLIDGALEESAPLIAASIRKLGFRPEDVRTLLINHAHDDHAGGLAALKRMTGATLVASAGDRPDLEAGRTIGRDDLAPFPPVRVDRAIGDGDRVTIGGTLLTAILTPGHTRGCTSWKMRTTEAGRPLDILFACSLSVAGQPLAGDPAYPRAARDFHRSFQRLRRERADIFLNYHAEGFNLIAKRDRLLAGDPFAFVDPGELPRRIDDADRAYRRELAALRASSAERRR